MKSYSLHSFVSGSFRSTSCLWDSSRLPVAGVPSFSLQCSISLYAHTTYLAILLWWIPVWGYNEKCCYERFYTCLRYTHGFISVECIRSRHITGSSSICMLKFKEVKLFFFRSGCTNSHPHQQLFHRQPVVPWQHLVMLIFFSFAILVSVKSGVLFWNCG